MLSTWVSLFYLYDPWLDHRWRMAFVMGLIAILALAYNLSRRSIRQISLPVDSCAVILGLISFSLIPLLIHDSTDFSVVKMYVKTLILFVFASAIYQWLYVNNKQKIILDLQRGVLIQFVFALFALFGIEFVIDFLLSVHIPLPRFYGSEQQYRLYNLTSSAFFQLSIFYCLLLHFLLAYQKAYGQTRVWWLLPLLIIGAMAGRTFLIFAWVSLFLYFQWRYLPSILVFLALAFGLAWSYPNNPYVAHCLEPLVNLLHGGQEFSSSTTTLMEKHLFMPEWRHFIAGDGYYLTEEGRYYGGSDSGFIRQILYGGIGYLLVCALFTAYFVIRVAQNWFIGSHRWLFGISTFALLSLFNIKADSYAFPGIMLVLLMFLSLFGAKGKQYWLKGGNKNV